MLKWLFTLVLAVLIIGVFTPWLRKLGSGNTGMRTTGSGSAGSRSAGSGRAGSGHTGSGHTASSDTGLRDIGRSDQGRQNIPGDFEIERGGKRFTFPIGSTILLSLLASLIFWLLR